MREVGEIQNDSNSHLFLKQQHYGGSGLETLTEVENEDDQFNKGSSNNSGNGDGIVMPRSRLNSRFSFENLLYLDPEDCPVEDDGDDEENEDGNEQTRCFGHSSLPVINDNSVIAKCHNCTNISRHQNDKIINLEKTIQQLRDELKECRDQNELLEFRLLEIQEFGLNSNSNDEFERITNENKPVEELIESTSSNSSNRNGSRKVLEYGAEVTSEEVMIQSEYQNNHVNVIESRSSCSDCSESLSFQESGIFDSQFAEESYGHHTFSSSYSSSSSSTPRETVVVDASTELAILSSQIENLILRLSSANNSSNDLGNKGDEITSCKLSAETSKNSKSKSRAISGSSSGRIMGKGKDLKDTSLELQSCRKQVQELEKRITPYLNSTYVNNLEDKISLLIQENRRLEEERSEMEEAENDSRNQCQRFEEKLRQVRDRNIILQHELSREKTLIEQLSFQMEEVQDKYDSTFSQLNHLESLALTYEQQNFELEESTIELKSSIQFLVKCWPLLQITSYVWSLWKSNEGTIDQQPRSTSRGQFPWSLLLVPTTTTSSKTIPTRKHKLRKLPSTTEPSFKKLRSEQNDRHKGIAEVEEEKEDCDESMITATLRRKKEESTRKNDESETQHCDINKYRKLLELEKIEVVEKYERKLVEMRKRMDEEAANSQRELQRLKENWDTLIKELEQSHATLNLLFDVDHAAIKMEQVQSHTSHMVCNVIETPKSSGNKVTAGNKIKGGSLVATRIQSLFPNEWRASMANTENKNPCSIFVVPTQQPKPSLRTTTSNCENTGKELILNLVQYFTAQKEKFEARENTLLNQIDQLKSRFSETPSHNNASTNNGVNQQTNKSTLTINVSSSCEDEQKRIVHLLEENNRLERLLSDQEKVWLQLKGMEEDNEKLTLELSNTTRLLKSKLENSCCKEKDLRNKVEELELNECTWKELLAKKETKEWKFSQEIQQLKEDADFFHSKSCQLQLEFDGKVEDVVKLKNEIAQLSAKLKLCQETLQEKESSFETTESALESQILQLHMHLKNLQQELGDSECTNGMLREEVLYLERTLQNSLEENVQSEDAMKILKCQMEEKIDSLNELKRECCNGMRDDKYGASAAINDLDVFAKNEGGLIGLAREIQDIWNVVQSCNRCENAAKKLSEVSEQLNTLTLMLGGYQENTFVYRSSEQEHNFLTRCESEEHITPATNAQHNGEMGSQHMELISCQNLIEENKLLHSHIAQLSSEFNDKELEVERLQRSISTLGVELCQLEKEFLARKNDLKESHLNELLWWKLRCQEKNDLIHLLARRIAHLSVTDSYGYFMDGILKEIRQIRDENYSNVHCIKSKAEETSPQDCNSLLNYFNTERRRLMDMLNSCTETENYPDNNNTTSHLSVDQLESVDFRVLRRISEDSLLVSWTIPEKVSTGLVDGYEISVNGNIFLRIPKPNRFKAILFGLNMSEPLELSLRCTGAYNTMQESCITFIA